MGRKKKVIKYYEIQDIRDSISYVYPSFSEEYAEDPEFYRASIAEECGMSYREAKTGLIMLLYGAGTQVQEGRALVEMMGKDRTERFLSSTLVKNIINGIKYLQ